MSMASVHCTGRAACVRTGSSSESDTRSITRPDIGMWVSIQKYPLQNRNAIDVCFRKAGGFCVVAAPTACAYAFGKAAVCIDACFAKAVFGGVVCAATRAAPFAHGAHGRKVVGCIAHKARVGGRAQLVFQRCKLHVRQLKGGIAAAAHALDAVPQHVHFYERVLGSRRVCRHALN